MATRDDLMILAMIFAGLCALAVLVGVVVFAAHLGWNLGGVL